MANHSRLPRPRARPIRAVSQSSSMRRDRCGAGLPGTRSVRRMRHGSGAAPLGPRRRHFARKSRRRQPRGRCATMRQTQPDSLRTADLASPLLPRLSHLSRIELPAACCWYDHGHRPERRALVPCAIPCTTTGRMPVRGIFEGVPRPGSDPPPSHGCTSDLRSPSFPVPGDPGIESALRSFARAGRPRSRGRHQSDIHPPRIEVW